MNIIEESYSLENDGFEGGASAIIVNPKTEENLLHYLEMNKVDNYELIYKAIKDKTEEIIIIKNIYIEEEYRGLGFGSMVLEDLISESLTEDTILICDIDEEQKDGFNLIKFYEEYGFKRINKDRNPVMVSENLYESIKNDLKIDIRKDKLKKNKI